MDFLELKIPPVLLVILFAFLMLVVDFLIPGIALHPAFQYTLATSLLLAGAAIALAGVRHFRKARTTVNPMSPESSANLVTEGVYRVTRNPMYVGFLLVLLGWATVLSNPASALLSVGFVLYMNRFQIIPEERALQTLFGDVYVNYKRQAPRWVSSTVFKPAAETSEPS